MMSNKTTKYDEVRAEVEEAAVVDKKNDFIAFAEICFWVVFSSVMFVLELAGFFSGLLTLALAALEPLGDHGKPADVTAPNSKQQGKLAPPSTAETTRADADDENEVLPVVSSEVKPLKSVWGKRSAGRLVHRANPVLPTRATPVLLTRATPVLPTRAKPVLATRANPVLATRANPVLAIQANPVLATQVTPVPATRASSTCLVVPVMAEKRDEASTRPDTIDYTFKFWKKRYSLFSKFDDGIMLDEESFYSVCPEVISKFMAEQCKAVKIAVDPFCGAGGNIIQLAKFCDKVIACDIDPHKIKMAKHNASLYGVSHKIEFIVGDFFELCGTIKGDAIVTSPPWGGLGYNAEPTIGPSAISLDKILEAGKSITSKMLLHLPKNLGKSECVQVCQANELRTVKMQNVFINKYLNCLLVYVKSDTSNCRDPPRISDAHFHEKFYNNGQDGGKKSYRDYLSRVERSMKMC